MEEENKINPCIVKIGWWVFKWKGVIHTYRRTNISKFMYCSETFHIHYECEKCGATKIEKFVEKDTLIMAGVSVEELENV